MNNINNNNSISNNNNILKKKEKNQNYNNNNINNDFNSLEAPYSYLYNPNIKSYDKFDIKDYETIQRIPIYKQNNNNSCRTLGNCKEFLDLVKQTLQNEDSSKYLAFYKIIVKPLSMLKMFVKISKLFENYPVLLKSFDTFLPNDFINWIEKLRLNGNKNFKELYFQRIFLYDHVVPDVIHSETFNYCYYFKTLG
ncbi:hypothetical protein DICPUDRAFT_84399 [Dictyostelium purpureum]|uniref:Uncharacterized protein n=1 Tax=Dictyostelium purpureum TaxID=5786 RepID=F1A2I9_DICPU|nr:uncharacterized protein DICPUDRAFT_84399 [Dictyostelium purpureum]EGC29581.1 hypothetical protein DICPUDRAFT_84399 [Dictyostelium purpureum]|eukprot:XP_003293883.1 hypothetical protein DICPUDRAFT_84399 [Dictyostelium purpureum]